MAMAKGARWWQLRGGTDNNNAHIGQYDKFSREYWILPISEHSPYWLLAIFIDTSDVAVLGHSKPIQRVDFRSEEGISVTKTYHHRHFEALTSRLIYLKRNRHNSSPKSFRMYAKREKRAF